MGSYINDSSFIQLAQPYQLRPIYSGTTLSGYMNETSSKNFCYSSQLRSDSHDGGTISTSYASNVIGPDGTYDDVTIIPSNFSDFIDMSTEMYTQAECEQLFFILSFYIKPSSSSSSFSSWFTWFSGWPRYNVTIESMNITQNDFDGGGISQFNTDWYRCYCNISGTRASDNNLWFYMVNNGSDTIYISHVQLEAFPQNTITTPTSWIPYNSTREADNLNF